MALPACHVLTHADWKKKRDSAGGKSGLSKVDLGKKLDEFHAVLKGQDVPKAEVAMKTLETAAKAYVSEVTKKFPKVAAVVNGDILNQIKAFGTAIEAQEKAAAARREGFRVKYKQDLMAVIAGCNKVIAEGTTVQTDVGALLKKFKDGVPADQAAAVKKVAENFVKKVEALAATGWKLEELAKPLAYYDSEVTSKFKEGTDMAIHLMGEKRQLIKWIRSQADLLAGLKTAA